MPLDLTKRADRDDSDIEAQRDTGHDLAKINHVSVEGHSSNDVTAEKTAEGSQTPADGLQLDSVRQDDETEVYSVFGRFQRLFIVLGVSFMAIISPLSGSMYLPAIPEISRDLGVSVSKINLTITTYMIFQGIAPSFIGNFSDSYGRRPAYVICIVIYLAANVGLALNSTYAGLITLRCIQSCGSSATIALGAATVSDLVTRAERGTFIGLASLGVTMGPALGPVAGGLITNRWGWRAVFWFLTALSGFLFLLLFVFLPETCRSVVGNGSIECPWWNRSLYQHAQGWRRNAQNRVPEDASTKKPAKTRPNPFAAMKILVQPGPGVVLWFAAFMYAGYFAILATLSHELDVRFGFSPVIIGLCYLPIAVGSIVTRWSVGRIIDWNFRRHAAKAGYDISTGHQQNMEKLDVERARLEASIPLIYLSCVAFIAYGWVMEEETSLAAIEVSLFFCGFFFAGALNGFNVLVVDMNQAQPATAMAANNLFRCVLGAGAVAAAIPLIDAIGMGWTGVFIAAIWVVFSPSIWIIMLFGYKWRKQKAKPDAE